MRKNAVCAIAGVFALLLSGCAAIDEEINPAAVCKHRLLLPVACTQRCTSPDPLPTDVVSACQDLILRRVAFAARCTGPGEPPTADDEAALVETCAGIATAPGVTLTPLEIRACGEQLDAASCLGGAFPSCAGYFGDLLYPQHDKKGTLPPGSECFANVQCDSGYCGDAELLTGCNICQRARAIGESCEGENDLCVGGCCGEGTCQLDGKRLGEQCSTYGGDNCQRTLYCDETAEGPLQGTCVPRIDAGAACRATFEDHCVPGFWCQEGVCAAVASPAEDGASCTDDGACASRWCHAGACAEKPTGLAVGEDCSVGSCLAGLLCDDATLVCIEPTYLPVGAACDVNSSSPVGCEPGLYCDRDGTCRPDPQPGEPCTYFAGCASGATCEDFDGSDLTKGRCVKLGKKGDPCPCREAFACSSGVCVSYVASVCE